MNATMDKQNESIVDRDFVIKEYQKTLNYYLSAAKKMERNYKYSRYFPVILGGLISLLSTISIASFVESIESVRVGLALGTIILASIQAMLSELLGRQNWGSHWKRLHINAHRIQKEYHRMLSTPEDKMNYKMELSIVNEIVLAETFAGVRSTLGEDEELPISNVKDE